MADTCGVCGGPDYRHRVVDTQMERVIAGEDIDDVAADHALSVEEMVANWQAAYTRALEGWSRVRPQEPATDA